MPPTVEVKSLDHWTTKEVPGHDIFEGGCQPTMPRADSGVSMVPSKLRGTELSHQPQSPYFKKLG